MKWLFLIPSLAFAQVGRAPFYVAPTVAVAGNAVAYITGTAVDGTEVGSLSSSSFIPSAGTNRAIYACITTWDEGGAVTIETVIGGGGENGEQPFELVGAFTGVGQDHVEIWRLLETSVALWDGSFPVTATAATTAPQSFSMTVLQLQYVNQADPDDAVVTASGSSGQPTCDVTSQANDMVLDHILYYNTTVSAGANQDKRQDSGPDAAVDSDAASTEPGTAGTVTMSWTGVTTSWAQQAININHE